MVPCKLCSPICDGADDTETEFSTLDDQKEHAQRHLQLASDDDGDQTRLKKVFAKCFPSVDFEESRSLLLENCKSIIDGKMNGTNSIKCQQCEFNVRFTDGNGDLAPKLILTHAACHAVKKPFGCRKCQFETSTELLIERHVKEHHKIASPLFGEHFDENWTECFDRVKESLTNSFGGAAASDPESSKDDDVQILSVVKRRTASSKSTKGAGSAKKRRSVSPLASDSGSSSNIQTPHRELTEQRQLIFSKLVKRAGRTKKLRCRPCKKEISAQHKGLLEQHVYSHMERDIYECKKCDGYSSISYSGVARHLNAKHGVDLNGNHYIDHSDEYHKEILDWVKTCFGKKAIE